MLGLSDVL